jgi:hypothetical protein
MLEIGEPVSLLLISLLVALLIHTLVLALRTGSYTWQFRSVLAEPFLVSRVKHPTTFRLLVAVNALTIIVMSGMVFESLGI